MSQEDRAAMTAAEINDLPDSAFAYIEAGGEKDDDGKTTPRGLRHYPIHDKAHADNALARANGVINNADANADDKAVAEKALPAIKDAVKKFADETEAKSVKWDAEYRAIAGDTSYSDMQDLLDGAVAAEFCGKKEWSYVCDFTDTYVIYSIEGETFQVDYSVDGTTVTFSGKPVEVTSKTTWVPLDVNVETNAAVPTGEERVDNANKPEEKPTTRVPAVPKRAFFSLTERPDPVSKLEVRMDTEVGDPNIAEFRGYASTTGQAYAVTDWLGEYRETIVPGAFAKTLSEQRDIPLLFNHDGIPLASTGSATSRLSEDGNGLLNEATFDRTDGQTNTICVQLKRGVLNKMSFSFRAVRDDWNDAYDERTVSELALFDTSIVTYPANPGTSAELRSQFREALGREGVATMFSARAALADYAETRTLEDAAEPIIEQAIRALASADEVMCRRAAGPYIRSRTFQVAAALEELRAGKKLSAKMQGLVASAADALAGASTQHAKVATAHNKLADKLTTATESVQAVLDEAATNVNDQAPNATGTGANQGATGGDNPINPKDGAGPRSVPASVVAARKQLDELKRYAKPKP